jgi:hypothetical protein
MDVGAMLGCRTFSIADTILTLKPDLMKKIFTYAWYDNIGQPVVTQIADSGDIMFKLALMCLDESLALQALWSPPRPNYASLVTK